MRRQRGAPVTVYVAGPKIDSWNRFQSCAQALQLPTSALLLDAVDEWLVRHEDEAHAESHDRVTRDA